MSSPDIHFFLRRMRGENVHAFTVDTVRDVLRAFVRLKTTHSVALDYETAEAIAEEAIRRACGNEYEFTCEDEFGLRRHGVVSAADVVRAALAVEELHPKMRSLELTERTE